MTMSPQRELCRQAPDERADCASRPQEARPATPAAPRVRRRSHSRSWVAAGAVAACAAAITTASIVPGSGSGLVSTALAVTRPDDSTVVIKILDAAEDPAALTRRLAAEHLSIRVEAVSASPQLVGRWLSSGADAHVSGALADSVAEQTVDKTADLVVPAHFAGTLSLTIGRPARPGEHPDVIGTPNALAPGGKLACWGLTGAEPAVALTTLQDAGWRVVWAAGGVRRPQASPEPGQRVVQAYVYDVAALASTGFALDGHSVQLVLDAPDDPRYDQLAATGYPARPMTDEDCGPSQTS